MSNIIDNTIKFVKKTLEHAEAGHDWFHVQRVYKNALTIANTEMCNLTVVKLAALLHDIADSKFHNGDENLGPQMAEDFLKTQQIEKPIINHVIGIIQNVSFHKHLELPTHQSKELDIVQDADRLDALGAVGIARAFHYGGYKNRIIYNPEHNPTPINNKADYQNNQNHTINHFYEKLLCLKDLMKTSKGRAMAENKHQFMIQFLSQFYTELE